MSHRSEINDVFRVSSRAGRACVRFLRMRGGLFIDMRFSMESLQYKSCIGVNTCLKI